MRSKISRPSCSISNWIVATLLMTCGWCSINCKAAKNQKGTVAATVSEGCSLCRCGGAEAKAGAFPYGARRQRLEPSLTARRQRLEPWLTARGGKGWSHCLRCAEAKAGALAYGARRQRLEPWLTAPAMQVSRH